MLTKDNAAISDFPNFLKEIILAGFLALYKYKLIEMKCIYFFIF